MILARPNRSTTQPDLSKNGDSWLQPQNSPVLARITRRPRLQHQIDNGAACITTAVGDFFRGDHETAHSWTARIPRLRTVCNNCPAQAACRELALRDREGRDTNRLDDMVRAGLTTHQLRDLGALHERGLEEAVARDDEATTRWPRRTGRAERPNSLTHSPATTSHAIGTARASAPRAGVIDDVEREDNAKGLEPDDDAFHQLVQRAPRTLAEMTGAAPKLPLRPTPHERDGRQEQEPDGRPHPQGIYEEDQDHCPICEHWICTCGTTHTTSRPALVAVTR
ncbi:hypothetical protein ACFWIA_28790 [Streptomyces sp. NPDC127068]|uniref:hypothetical protein n=1 Tax=Streptomyces sp. NPDC127068 TaxID=3347127 RepID=UPI0036631CAA